MAQPTQVRDILLAKLAKDLDRAMIKVQRIKQHIEIIEKALPKT